MERFFHYAAIILAVAVIKACLGESDNGSGITPQSFRTPTIYNMPSLPPATISPATPLPKLEIVEMPKLEMPKLEIPKIELPKLPPKFEIAELPAIVPPKAPNIDSLAAEIEATRFRLPELSLKISEATE